MWPNLFRVVGTRMLQVYAGVGLLAWLFQKELFFAPKPVPPDVARRLAHNAISITAESDIVLHGWLRDGNSAAPQTDCDLLVYFGGRADEMSRCATENSRQFSCPQWYINYRGYGQSDGEPAADVLRSDALRVYDATVQKWQSHNNTAPKICVMGRSLGSHMAAHVAANREVHKLILVTPFAHSNNVARETPLKIYPVEEMAQHNFDTLTEAPKCMPKHYLF